MSGSGSWLGRDSIVVVGFVLVFAGMGALGWWLAAAAHRAVWQVVGAGTATVVFLSAGLVLLACAHRRRGGLLGRRRTRDEVQTYHKDWRR